MRGGNVTRMQRERFKLYGSYSELMDRGVIKHRQVPAKTTVGPSSKILKTQRHNLGRFRYTDASN